MEPPIPAATKDPPYGIRQIKAKFHKLYKRVHSFFIFKTMTLPSFTYTRPKLDWIQIKRNAFQRKFLCAVAVIALFEVVHMSGYPAFFLYYLDISNNVFALVASVALFATIFSGLYPLLELFYAFELSFKKRREEWRYQDIVFCLIVARIIILSVMSVFTVVVYNYASQHPPFTPFWIALGSWLYQFFVIIVLIEMRARVSKFFLEIGDRDKTPEDPFDRLSIPTPPASPGSTRAWVESTRARRIRESQLDSIGLG